MTELQIKVEPESAQAFKAISQKVFRGNDSLAFERAVQFLGLLDDQNHFERFWEIADRMRKQVQKAGGLSAKEIDLLVRESRERRRKRNSQ
ncbi:hypothetical protein EDS67_14070 [candidate division KSB1 bacterium]|nr:MAG: hypothetical protein EDS67_14070 [candidate division KSB1 bacterium]MBC6952253.1 hypothetical protein [candidate division KSB1 bacterium]MCE7942418.1 hypothetical protein [Chlorobi bacterium CHB1]MDL1874473.1 hypothetical protein [Cytophagia bacterium CHB2]